MADTKIYELEKKIESLEMENRIFHAYLKEKNSEIAILRLVNQQLKNDLNSLGCSKN